MAWSGLPDYASCRTLFGHGPSPPRPVVRPDEVVTPLESAVPKSQVRKKKVYTPPTDMRPTATAATRKPSPVWLPITAVALIVFGIGWLVVYYLSEQAVPGRGVGLLEPRGRASAAWSASLVLLSRWR